MSQTNDPTRLASQPGTTVWLQSALSSARAEAPSSDDVERLTLRVEAAIAAGLPGPEIAVPAQASAGPISSANLALIGIGVALGVAVGTAWKLTHPPPRVSAPAAVALSAPPAAPSSTAEYAPKPGVSAAPVDEPLVAQEKELATSVTARTANERDARHAAPNEAALLDTARSALKTDPRRALSLTQEHAKRFPKSVLGQEREVIAIEALNRLGQTASAKARAENFARLYPGSAHQQKIDQTIRGK